MRLFLRAGMSVAILSALACTDIDTTRNPAPRGTIGEEVYGAFCDRVASLVFPEDLTGDSYRDVCHKNNGQYANAVDETLLPPITSDGVDIKGNPVSTQTQAASRAYAKNRVGALARRRADLIAALDATIPDVLVPIKDTHNPEAAQSCGVPSVDQISLGKALADMLGRFGPLVDDGTMPRSTESLATLMQSIQGSAEAQKAFVRLASRIGYRPVLTTLGAARPSVSYDKLRDLANATLGLISPDSTPYDVKSPRDSLGNRIPVPGPANAQLNQVVATAQQELRTATIDPPPAPLKITLDPYNGRQLLSRPRTNLEALGVVMMAENQNFGSGASRYIVRRDSRGFASVPYVNNALPAPFVDNDADGLPDVDPATGLFVSSNGTAPPSPFFSADALTKATAYDPFDRSLVNNALLYGYVDTTHTFSASMLTDVQPLVNPDINQKHESLMYMLGGAYVMLGTRDGGPSTQRVYTANGESDTITYDAYHPENSPLVDLIYAVGQILGDPSTDDVLVLTKSLMQNHQNDLARVIGAGLAFKDVANKHPEATLQPKSTFWDEIIDVMVQVEQEPGLLEDVLRSTESPQSAFLGGVFANYMQFKDHMTYDHKNLNGPVFDVDTNNNAEMSQVVDRTKPLTGWNRSAFQKFVQLVHDTNGVTACNKEGAVLHAQGVPLLGSGDICAGTLALCGAPGTRPFHQCEVFKIENLAKFYVDSIVGKANIYLRPSVLRNGILGIGAATVDMMQQSSGITGFWDAGSSHNIRPKPNFLSRQVYFDIDNDSPNPGDLNYKTNHFLNDLMGNHLVGTVLCPENVIPDPDPSAADASADGYVHGLRLCSSGESVDKKDPDALFVLENFGAFAAFAPTIQAFANHNREDLYLALMETIYRHWANKDDDKSNCDPSGTAKTNPEYCTQDALDSYEPLLAEAFPGDFFPALAAVTIDTDTTSVAHCTNANGSGTCTAQTPLGGINVLANATRALLDPKTAKALSLVDHHGKVTGLRNDGTTNPQVTPIYLLTEALNEIDAAFAAFPQTDPSDADRQANWRLGRSQLVDQFLAIKGTGASSTFGDVSIPTITPTLVDMLRSQMNANCPTSFVPPYTRCNWARDDLTNKISDSIKGPFFSTTMDLLDAIRRDDAARSALESLLGYLANAASQNDALASLLATTDDLLQVMNDDQNLVPIYHALAPALSPTQRDSTGHILSASVIDSQLTLLSRVAGKFMDGSTEICADEADPNQILPQILTRLVTPMKDTSGRLTQTPLEVIIDVIADVNRADPSQTSKLAPGDYGAIAGQVSDFLMNKQFGLEQFYEIVRKGTD